MSTTIKRFTDAYASMTVAVYEPLILKWVSMRGLDMLAIQLARRVHSKSKGPDTPPGGLAIGAHVRAMSDKAGEAARRTTVGEFTAKTLDGVEDVSASKRPFTIDSSVFKGPPKPGDHRVALTFNRSMPLVLKQPGDLDMLRAGIRKQLRTSALNWVERGGDLGSFLKDSLQVPDGWDLPWLHLGQVEEALSPIGIAHFYRQLYFHIEEGVGPLEQCFTVAPQETLEVLYETTRRLVHEEVVETGQETTTESEVEQKNLEEVSDKVSSMIQRDASASMSANASGSIGVWSAGASASSSFGSSVTRGRDESSRRLKEVTRRASERITKSFTIQTRSLDEVATRNLTRRVISNTTGKPVSYGLRRVLRKAQVKVQSLGPKLVWQIYVRDPGKGLARSTFVHFRDTGPISVPEIPPGVPPAPQGGVDAGSTSTTTGFDPAKQYYFVALSIQVSGERKAIAVSIDQISNANGGDKDDIAPSVINEIHWDDDWDEATNTFTCKIAINPGRDGSTGGPVRSVNVSYTYAWDPSDSAMSEWNRIRQAAVDKITEELLQQKFDREKQLITAKSKIAKRPSADLRREERFELLSRMVSHFAARGEEGADPSPLEIEYFHRYFDIEGIFFTMHPSWWRPRYAPIATGFGRPAYEITDESDPAPMGASLGWMLQMDGDTRRNEFLNSPWARVCVPFKPNREREAIEWIASYFEDKLGYDVTKAPLKTLIEDLEARRARETQLGIDGPEYVTVSSTPGAPSDPAVPAAVYPIINQFEVTLPTDGFVYDALKIDTD